MPAKNTRPVEDDLRCAYLVKLRDHADEADALLWIAVQLYLDTGTDPARIASCLGLSRSTLYRRLSQFRDQAGTEGDRLTVGDSDD